MKWEEFLNKYGGLPVIEAETALAGVPNSVPLKVQISRWEKAGKLIQAKRGVYLFAQVYRKTPVFWPYLASVLKKPSYISFEKALEYYDLIPEAVWEYCSVTTKMPAKFYSKEGRFTYRHIKQDLFWGYVSATMHGQTGFIASPEKALLDLIYFKGFKIIPAYIEELRLQNVKQINLKKLMQYARMFKKPRMLRAAKLIQKFIQEEKPL